MKTCTHIRQSAGGEWDFSLFLEILSQPHVVWNVSRLYRDILGIHWQLSRIEDGIDRFYLCYGAGDDFLGCIIGAFQESAFVGHLFFHRQVDVASCIRVFEAHLKAQCAADGHPLHSLVGNVPDSNRAVKVLLRRLGFQDKGLLEGAVCKRGKEQKDTLVRQFVKEV